jgi:hypothetical protein
MALAILGVLAVAGLSACADLDRLGQPQTPYDGPAHQVSSIYSTSYDSSAPASFVKAQSRAADAMRKSDGN